VELIVGQALLVELTMQLPSVVVVEDLGASSACLLLPADNSTFPTRLRCRVGSTCGRGTLVSPLTCGRGARCRRSFALGLSYQ
jgi:hypothetical protein